MYDDAKRLATYTGKAHMIGAEGDRHGEKLELYLKPDTNELERAEGYGANGNVIVKESGPHRHRGAPHLHRGERDAT